MTPAEASALEILKWAISPNRPVSEGQSFDEETLLTLAVHHRIVGPLIARLDSVRPVWCPTRFRTRLRIKQHETRTKVEANLDAAREISRAMRVQGLEPPIFVKGFAAYALTANPDLMHYSGDLDPFAEDLPALWDALVGIGYSGHRKETHEWAKMRRGGITLDLHQHFPCLAYPDNFECSEAKLAAWRNPGHWTLPADKSNTAFRDSPVRWADLSAGAVPGRAAGTEELLFPSPAALCLIHCAHCFRVCMTRLHYMDLFGGFRLYELLNIFALAGLPDFDAEEFTRLVERFSAQDAVRLVNALAETALGAKALPEKRSRSGDTAALFAEHLFYGGWVLLQSTEDWLLRRGFEQMLTQLDAPVVSHPCRLLASEAPRLLTHGSSPPLPRIDIAWDTSRNTIVFDWALPNAPLDCSQYELLIHFGFGSMVQVSLNADLSVGAIFEKSDYGQINTQASQTLSADSLPTVRLTCSVPRHPFQAASRRTEPLPLFLAVRRFYPDSESTQSASYLPLLLCP